MFRWHAAEVAPTIPVPMLVLAGSKDIVTLPAASNRIASTAPLGELRLMEGAGHMGFMERADAYDQAIAAFAQDVFARAT